MFFGPPLLALAFDSVPVKSSWTLFFLFKVGPLGLCLGTVLSFFLPKHFVTASGEELGRKLFLAPLCATAAPLLCWAIDVMHGGYTNWVLFASLNATLWVGVLGFAAWMWLATVQLQVLHPYDSLEVRKGDQQQKVDSPVQTPTMPRKQEMEVMKDGEHLTINDSGVEVRAQSQIYHHERPLLRPTVRRRGLTYRHEVGAPVSPFAWYELVRAGVALNVLMVQFAWSGWVGVNFSSFSEGQKLLVCGLYPFVVFGLKVLAKKAGHYHPRIVLTMEFASITLASIPYRTIFLFLLDPTTFTIVVAFTFVYKFFVYVLVLTETFRHLRLSILRTLHGLFACGDDAAEVQVQPEERRSSVASDSLSVGPPDEDLHTSIVHSVETVMFSRKFFFHSAAELNGALGILAILQFIRSAHPGSEIGQIDDDDWDSIVLRFFYSFLADSFIIVLIYFIARRTLRRSEFKPLVHTRPVLDDNIGSFMAFVVLAYVATLLIADETQVPERGEN